MTKVRSRSWIFPAWVLVPVVSAAIAVGGCVGPPVLKQQVIAYDEVTSEIEQALLLLNIARVDNGRTVHFTTTSSIAATFDWTTTVGASGRLNRAAQTNFFDLSLGSSASENPTFSIVPISGEDFTQRILTPFWDDTFEFLVFQGGAIDRVMRLMASGVEVQNPDGSFVRFIENNPDRNEEYEEFRRLAMHLRWLNENRQLFVRSLVFEQLLVKESREVPSPEEFNNAFSKGLEWRRNPNGTYDLFRVRAGATVVTNFDPMALTDQQRFELNERIKNNPKGVVYVEIRPDRPGGDFAIQGAIKLRSILQILTFVANSIRTNPEFDVSPDPRTKGAVSANLPRSLQINVTDGAPASSVASFYYEGRYYSVNDTVWDRATFAMLGDLFQTAVGDVEDVGIPITISK